MLVYPEEFVFFWRGPFSQWYPSNFNIKGINYNCAEQYMMAEKAGLFEDYSIYGKVLSETDPKQMKKFGRLIKGFREDIWIENRFTVVLTGSIAKFTQNEELKKMLLDTGLKTLVEASPYDKVWGIGLKEDDPRALDRKTWEGLNLLGQALTITREYIKLIIYKENNICGRDQNMD